MSEPVYISLEFTPNPNTLKFAVNRQLIEFGGASFATIEEAEKRSPLAKKVLEINGIVGVMIGKDFVTITKNDEGDWDVVHQSALKTIETHLNANEPVLLDDGAPASTESKETTDLEKRIISILDEEIRPAVAMDGGDITFERFEDGIVYLFLQGSCAGCPSATATLKQGIEVRLKREIPDIKEVVSV